MESGGGGRGPAEPSPREEDEEEEEEEEALPAEAAWSLVDGAMEAEALADLPTATIACNLDPRVFQEGPCRVSMFFMSSWTYLVGGKAEKFV